jgi:hypothetical protein
VLSPDADDTCRSRRTPPRCSGRPREGKFVLERILICTVMPLAVVAAVLAANFAGA